MPENNECQYYRDDIWKDIETNKQELKRCIARIEDLEQYKARSEERMEHFKSLIGFTKWFICTLTASFITFFFVAIQANVFKK